MADLGVSYSYSNLIHWGNSSIIWNPDCKKCTEQSLGEGCNSPHLEDSAFFVCRRDIFKRDDLVVTCMGCKLGIENYGDAFKLGNPHFGMNETKWLHHSCWRKSEMAIYIYSKSSFFKY